MPTKNWKNAFTALWKSATQLSTGWNREKKRPSFWILSALFLSITVAAFSGEAPGDPWIPRLLQKGWIARQDLCPNLLPGQFAEIDGLEIYYSRTAVTFISRVPEEEPESPHCRVISEPTFVEEL